MRRLGLGFLLSLRAGGDAVRGERPCRRAACRARARAGRLARPGGDREALAAARVGARRAPGARAGGLPAAPRRLLRGDRLPPPRDEARGERIPVRRLLHLGPAPRRRQDEAAAGCGGADPRARPELPRAGRVPLRDLDEVGREHRLELVRRRHDGARAHGGGGLRLLEGRHVGRSTRSRPPSGRTPGQARANVRELLRGLYEGDGTRPTRGAVFITGLGQQTNNLGQYQTNLQNWLSDSGVLGGHVDLRQRLVAGGLRRLPQLGRPRRGHGHAARLPQRLPPAPARPRRAPGRRRSTPLARISRRRTARSRTRRGSGTPAYGWTAVPAAQMAAYVSARGLLAAVLQRRDAGRRPTTGGSRGRRGTDRARLRRTSRRRPSRS